MVKKLLKDQKMILLNIISTKSVSFVLNKNIDIPKDLKEFKPSYRQWSIKTKL